EPAAILIRAFEVDVGGPLSAFEYRKVRGAGVEPDIENVVLLAPFHRAARAFRSSGQKLFRRMRVPGVGAFLFEPLHHVAKRGEVLQLPAAALAEEHDDGHAPEALARDTPVRALFDHFVDTVLAPAGNPFHAVNFLERFLAKRLLPTVRRLIHVYEPLFRGPENDRMVTAPAVWVAVLIRMVAQQGAAIAQQFHDDGVRSENILAFVFGQAFGVNAFVV